MSSSGDWLASGGADSKIILWDFKTARQYTTLSGHSDEITALAFHPSGSLLFSSSLDSTIRVWDLQTEACIDTIRFVYPLHKLALSSTGDTIAVAGQRVTLISYPALLRKTLPLKPRHEFTSLAFKPNDQKLAIGGRHEDLGYIVDLQANTVTRKFAASFMDVTFDPEADKIVYCTNQALASEVNLSEKSKKGTSSDWMLNTYNAVALSENHLFLGDNVGEIHVIDRETFYETAILKTGRVQIRSLIISTHQNCLLSALSDGRILAWSLENFLPFKEFRGFVSKINTIAFSPDGTEILIGYADGTVRKTNLITNHSLVNSAPDNNGFAYGRINWSVHEITSFTQDSASFIFYRQRLSPEQDGTFDKIDQYQVTWLFDNNQLHFTEQKYLTGMAFQYIEDRKRGFNHSEDFLRTPPIISANSKHGEIKTEDEYLILTKPGGEIKKIKAIHHDLVTSIAVNEGYDFFATAGWDGLIRFRDLNTGELLCTFGPFKGGQFIYIHPDGYYFSSKQSLEYVGFKSNHSFYSFDQFDAIYNRPDIVAATLPYFNETYVQAYRLAYEKRLTKLGLKEENRVLIAPFLHYSVLQRDPAADEILLQVSCADSLSELDRLHVLVNGVPEYGRFGKKLVNSSYTDTLHLKLNPGNNLIQLFCSNQQGIASVKESFTAEYTTKSQKSTLYLVSMGVSNYQQSNYNLTYARKDAEDIIDWFSSHSGPFGKVKTKLLVDSSVTRSQIQGLYEFIAPATENDVVILFIAGHGVLDQNLDYYLAGYDMDFSQPGSRGIPYDLLEDLLDHTKSRQKVLLIDACHSGEIDKDDVIKTDVINSDNKDIKFRSGSYAVMNTDPEKSFDLAKSLFADMRLNNGATVISSSGGTEYAIESESWRNGAFTYCLLNGLSTGTADLNRDHMIYLSELQSYLLASVNKLTSGRQTPTSRIENLNNDFRLK